MALADVPVVLVEACRRGDRSAIERLVRLVTPDIYRFVYSMLRNHEDTDEVVQESLVRVFRYIANLKDPGRFAPWAMRITVNQVQTWRMRQNRRRQHEVEEFAAPDEGAVVVTAPTHDNPREVAIRREMRLGIEQAMAALPDRQQTAVVLFEIEGCSIKEIAQAMACSEGAVKFNIHEARKKLKRRLGHLMQQLKKPSALADEAKRREADGGGP